mmetsp:Transcript_37298/g.64101  ORF Transcript_37298/g.64101 Transcript_37298/m.64101 type:complete len:90 (-) Transcript_37298:61-330(-)
MLVYAGPLAYDGQPLARPWESFGPGSWHLAVGSAHLVARTARSRPLSHTQAALTPHVRRADACPPLSAVRPPSALPPRASTRQAPRQAA